jgi:hypothetical protein
MNEALGTTLGGVLKKILEGLYVTPLLAWLERPDHTAVKWCVRIMLAWIIIYALARGIPYIQSFAPSLQLVEWWPSG